MADDWFDDILHSSVAKKPKDLGFVSGFGLPSIGFSATSEIAKHPMLGEAYNKEELLDLLRRTM